MMSFSPRLLGARVKVHADEVLCKGEVVVLYEGRQWTAMCHVLLLDGPGKGYLWSGALTDILFDLDEQPKQ